MIVSKIYDSYLYMKFGAACPQVSSLPHPSWLEHGSIPSQECQRLKKDIQFDDLSILTCLSDLITYAKK